MRPSQVPPPPPLHPLPLHFNLHEILLPQGHGSPLTMSPPGLFFPASVGDTLVAATQWDQDSPMAQYQEKPLRSLCSPTTHPGHPSTLRNPSQCPFHHPLTPSREHPASPPSPSSCPCLSTLLFLLPLPPSRVHPALGDREMSLSSRHLAPCILPRPRILRVLSALGRSREVSRTREWMQGDALGTIVLSDRARRSKQDRLSP